MAFMIPPSSARTGEDRLPVLGFNAKAGRLFLHDRVQMSDGEWQTVKTDITMRDVAFAVDFLRLEVGWVNFSDGRAPLWAMAPYGSPMPPQPDSPGSTAAGKALRYKAGFRVPVVSQAIGGVRELAGNAGALIAGMNELHTQYEESSEGRAGKIPLVRMTNVVEVRAGQSSNFQPVFTIVRFVDRPVDLLGPCTVPVPGEGRPEPRAAAPRPTPLRVVTPPAPPAPVARMPQPVRAAPVDAWDDEPQRVAMPARVAAGAWRDEIPF